MSLQASLRPLDLGAGMAAIAITTQTTILVPPNVSTLLLAANAMARYRRLEILTHAVLWMSIDGTPAAVGNGIPLIRDQGVHEWSSLNPADNLPSVAELSCYHEHTADPVFVTVLEGE